MSVQSERVLRVAKVEAHHLVERRAAAAGDLPETGDARLGFEHAAAVPGLVLLDLVRQRRPRADERHVAAQHVPELRQLVEARLAQNASDRRDARIVGQLEHLLAARAVSAAFALMKLLTNS